MRSLLMPLALAAALSIAPPAAAAPAGCEVLVLYHENYAGATRGESVFGATETVLNHLGFVVRYWDLADGLPPEGPWRGVVSLADTGGSADPAALAAWLCRRLDAAVPVALLTGTGVLEEGADGQLAPPEARRAVLERLGATEATLAGPVQPGPHAPFEAAAPASTEGFRFAPATESFFGDGHGAALGVVSEHGAVVADADALRYSNPLTFRLVWRVDPFWLLGRALGARGPVLDTTTLNGRRVFYAHIDGDGFSNVVNRRDRRWSAEVVRDEVLARTWLPTTVSFVAGEVIGKPRFEAIARDIWRLPNTQAASHSYTHPHDWEHGILTAPGAYGDAGIAEAGGKRSVITPQHEIADSVKALSRLLPAHKQIEAMFWSGMTNPPEAYVAQAEALGLANLNGGDAVLDPRFPSYAQLSPLARRVGGHWQVYTSCANENLFTNLWTGPFDGHRHALALYRFSGAPRRLAPVNIYYHFYAAEQPAGLKALQGLYRWAEAQPLAHLTARDYCRVVEGFLGGEVAPEGETWRVSHAGACRTLRFDHEPRGLDWAACENVAGFARSGETLYVHLAAESARVALTPRPERRPYLAEASAPLARWNYHPGGIRAGFVARAPLTVVLAGFEPGAAVKVRGALPGAARADAWGRLTLAAAAGPRDLEVTW